MDAVTESSGTETLDPILGGRLTVYQPRHAGRFSLDALLLADFVRFRAGASVVDLGTGTGVVALILAARGGAATVLGVDLQASLVALAQRSAAHNGLTERLRFRQGDLRRPEALSPPGCFDVAAFNPPYRRLRSGRVNPDPERALARHEVAGGAAEFLAAAAYLLRDGGRAAAIYPATRLAALLCRMREAGIEPKRLRLVHSRREGAAVFALLEGVKGGGEEMTVLPPLILYADGGGYTAEAAALFSGASVPPVPAPAGGRSPGP